MIQGVKEVWRFAAHLWVAIQSGVMILSFADDSIFLSHLF